VAEKVAAEVMTKRLLLIGREDGERDGRFAIVTIGILIALALKMADQAIAKKNPHLLVCQ
jgi:hypothetical protein